MKDPQKFGYGFCITYNLMSAVRLAAKELLGLDGAVRPAVLLAFLAGRVEFPTTVKTMHAFFRDFARGLVNDNLDALQLDGFVIKEKGPMSFYYWASDLGRIKAQPLEEFFLGKVDRSYHFTNLPKIDDAERIQWITLSRKLLYGDSEPKIAQTSSVVGYVKAFDNYAAWVISTKDTEVETPASISKLNNNAATLLSILPSGDQEPVAPRQIQKALVYFNHGTLLREMRLLMKAGLAVRVGKGQYHATPLGAKCAVAMDRAFFQNLGARDRADWIALSLNILGAVMPQDAHKALMTAITQPPSSSPS